MNIIHYSFVNFLHPKIYLEEEKSPNSSEKFEFEGKSSSLPVEIVMADNLPSGRARMSAGSKKSFIEE